MSGRALDRASHACILSAQVVIAAGYAATGDPQSPVLLYLLWSHGRAGIYREAAVEHLAEAVEQEYWSTIWPSSSSVAWDRAAPFVTGATDTAKS